MLVSRKSYAIEDIFPTQDILKRTGKNSFSNMGVLLSKFQIDFLKIYVRQSRDVTALLSKNLLEKNTRQTLQKFCLKTLTQKHEFYWEWEILERVTKRKDEKNNLILMRVSKTWANSVSTVLDW